MQMRARESFGKRLVVRSAICDVKQSKLNKSGSSGDISRPTYDDTTNPSQPSIVECFHSTCVRIFRRPDLPVDPENLKVRESSDPSSTLDNRFSGSSSAGNAAPKKKCGLQTFMNRIVGGEICELDEFPWAALLLYESSEEELDTSSEFQINFSLPSPAFQSRQISQ